MKEIGIGLDSNYDLKVEEKVVDGKICKSLVIENITAQNQALLLLCHKGEFKEDPMAGVGINDIIHEHDFISIKREIMYQLERDGQRVSRLVLNSNNLEIESFYRKD